MRHTAKGVLLTAVLWSAGYSQGDAGLAAGFRMATTDGTLIDVPVGHAAPLLADWDGDGVTDLLVGQLGEGLLRIYRNAGTLRAPKFDGFETFKAGGTEGKVPTG
jgi:hypothetical protein